MFFAPFVLGECLDIPTSLARSKFRPMYRHWDDLQAVMTLAMFQALKRFDPRKGSPRQLAYRAAYCAGVSAVRKLGTLAKYDREAWEMSA